MHFGNGGRNGDELRLGVRKEMLINKLVILSKKDRQLLGFGEESGQSDCNGFRCVMICTRENYNVVLLQSAVVRRTSVYGSLFLAEFH